MAFLLQTYETTTKSISKQIQDDDILFCVKNNSLLQACNSVSACLELYWCARGTHVYDIRFIWLVGKKPGNRVRLEPYRF